MKKPTNATPAAAPLESEGYLALRIGTGGGILPVPYADIEIKGAEDGNRDVIFLLTADASGNTAPLSLPAPALSLSQSPSGVGGVGYSLYDVTVFKDGYYTEYIKNLPIFPGITSRQFVELLPQPAFRPGENPPIGNLTIDEGEPYTEGGGLDA